MRDELEGIFASARFPFRHDRHVPSLVVRATPGDDGLDPTFRGDEPWHEERKRALIERGYRLTDDALAAIPISPTDAQDRDLGGAGAQRPPLGFCATEAARAGSDLRTV